MASMGHGEARTYIERLMAARALGQPMPHRRHSHTSVDRAAMMQRLAKTLTTLYVLIALIAIAAAVTGLIERDSDSLIVSALHLVMVFVLWQMIGYCERCGTIHITGRHRENGPVEVVRPRKQPKGTLPQGWAPKALRIDYSTAWTD